MIGETLGSFRIVSQIGTGGMGVIYRAEHQMIGKRAAIKVLRPELSRDREVIGRFFNEAKAVTAIDHPGLVDVFDFGYATDGSAYIVMELLSGESLGTRLRRERGLPFDVAVALTRQLCGALGAAHARQIVHRDLKPDNIYLTPDPDVAFGLRAKVLDFGIAKLAPGIGGLGMPETRTGMLLGTPLYMAPEQCRGAGEVDHRADIYSLGVILFEMVCGRVPFTAAGLGEVIAMQQLVAPPQPRSIAPALPPAIDALILRMLAKQPEQRPQTMADVLAALDGRGTAPVVETVATLGGQIAPTVASGSGGGSSALVAGTAPAPIAAAAPSPYSPAPSPYAPAPTPSPYPSAQPPKRRGALYAIAAVVGAGAIATGAIALHYQSPPPRPSAPIAALALLPESTVFVFHADAAKIEQSALWRAEGPTLLSLFAHVDEEHLLEKLRSRCDLDPVRDLRSVSFAFGAASTGLEDGAIVLDGEWDRDKLDRCVAALWPATAARAQPTEVAGSAIRLYSDTYVTWLAPHVAALAPSHSGLPYLRLLADHAAAAGSASPDAPSAADRPALRALAAAVDPDAAVWFAADDPAGLPRRVDPFGALDHAVSASLSLAVGEELTGHFELTATPAQAGDLAQRLAAQLADARARFPIVDEIHAAATGTRFAIDVHLDAGKLATLAGMIDSGLNTAIRDAEAPPRPLEVPPSSGSDAPVPAK